MTKKVCIITGGTRGIGFASVKAFLKEGYQVVFYGSKEETVTNALKNLNYDNVEGRWINLNDEKLVNEDFTQIKEKYGTIDVLINNAGLSDSASFLDYDVDRFDKIMNLNLRAVYITTHAAATIMKEQNHGVILNTSSMVSLYGQSAGVAYPVSKFAINGLTKSLARELGKYGISVNAVA